MSHVSPPLAGAEFFCELRPNITEKGQSYLIVNRTRILGWHKDAGGRVLPITAHGPVSYAAFEPDNAAPLAGFAWCEVRDTDGTRKWWSAMAGHLPGVAMRDKDVKELLHLHAAKAKRRVQEQEYNKKRGLDFTRLHAPVISKPQK